MAQHIVRSVGWNWDKRACILWATVTFTDGAKASVGFPLAQVVATFDACAAEVGMVAAPFIGDVDSVDGLFSSIKSAVKSVGKVAQKAVRQTTKVLNTAAKTASTVVRSKYTGYGLAAVAAVFPAVGAPALAAQQAAKRALEAVEDARRAARSGIRTANTVARVARGGNVIRSVRALSASNNPQARLAVAALKSI